MQKVALNGPNCGWNCKLLGVHLLTLAGCFCPPREELKSIKRHKWWIVERCIHSFIHLKLKRCLYQRAPSLHQAIGKALEHPCTTVFRWLSLGLKVT
jgi:hypothetical protein